MRTGMMTGHRNGRIGFAPTDGRKPGQRRARALVQLIAAVGLVISLAVAATAVSIGIARAQSDVRIAGTATATMPTGVTR